MNTKALTAAEFQPRLYFWVYRTLLTVKLPALYLNPRLPRRSEWQDAHETAVSRAN